MQWVIKPREYGRKIYASELADIVLYKQFENKKEHKNYIIFTKIFIESPCLSHVRVLK